MGLQHCQRDGNPSIGQLWFSSQGNPHSQANHKFSADGWWQNTPEIPAKLSEQTFLMLYWLKRITRCFVVTVFPVIICLNKRAHHLTCSHRAYSSSSLPGSVLCLRWSICPCCVQWHSVWEDWVKGRVIQCSGKREASWLKWKPKLGLMKVSHIGCSFALLLWGIILWPVRPNQYTFIFQLLQICHSLVRRMLEAGQVAHFPVRTSEQSLKHLYKPWPRYHCSDARLFRLAAQLSPTSHPGHSPHPPTPPITWSIFLKYIHFQEPNR